MIKFLKENKAATALEFGLVFPILLLILLSIVEFGFTMFYDTSLNAGIREVARTGVAVGYADMTPINNTMKKNLGGLYDSGNAIFVMRTFNSFAAMNTARIAFTSNPDSFFTGPQPPFPAKLCPPGPPINCQSAQIVLYGVRYNWGGITKIFPFVPPHLYSFSVVRNENYTQ